MWFGKIIAGLIGLLVAGPFGLVIGIIVGHYFDRGLANVFRPVSSQQRHDIEREFFQTTFLLMGKLAKADGRISEAEVAHTEQLMAQMGLHSDHRREAITLFKRGAQDEFSIDGQLQSFRSQCGRFPNLARQLLNYLLSLALADGNLSPQEEAVLRQIATGLGISRPLFDQLIRMIRAQTHFKDYNRSHDDQFDSKAGHADELATAYDALGIDSTATDATVKKAWRKLMSENHPDKLMGQGVPEDMIKLATERAQEIQTAYELIRKHRGI